MTVTPLDTPGNSSAIVSRHDPKLPFKPRYVFAEHNTDPSLSTTVQQIRKHGIDGDG